MPRNWFTPSVVEPITSPLSVTAIGRWDESSADAVATEISVKTQMAAAPNSSLEVNPEWLSRLFAFSLFFISDSSNRSRIRQVNELLRTDRQHLARRRCTWSRCRSALSGAPFHWRGFRPCANRSCQTDDRWRWTRHSHSTFPDLFPGGRGSRLPAPQKPRSVPRGRYHPSPDRCV